MSDMESSQSDEDHMHIASKPSGIRRESDVIVLQGQLQDNDRGSQTFPRRVSSSISAPSNKSSSIHRRYIVTPSEGAQAQGSSTDSSTESLSDDTLGFERSQVALRSFTLKEKRPQVCFNVHIDIRPVYGIWVCACIIMYWKVAIIHAYCCPCRKLSTGDQYQSLHFLLLLLHPLPLKCKPRIQLGTRLILTHKGLFSNNHSRLQTLPKHSQFGVETTIFHP